MVAGIVAVGSSQQKVSRFHTLQLKFSNRLPFSNDSAHFEKTTPFVRTFKSLDRFLSFIRRTHSSTC